MSDPEAPPRSVIAGLVVAGVLVVWWLVSHLYSGPDSPSCQDRYAQARTSEETLSVDRRRPEHYELASGATTCAEVRMKARGSHALVGAPLLLSQAIAATGGDSALAPLSAFEWSGSATVHTPAKDVDILGTWRLAPPDTASITTWQADQDSTHARAMIVAGDRGWMVHGSRTDPMPAAMLTEERHQFYLYSLLRLLPLKEPGVTLTLALADSTGEPGILVHREGQLDVELYFGTDQRVSRIHTRFAALPGSPSDDEEVRLEGTVEIAGAHWFRQMHILRNGKPYFDLVVIDGRLATSRPASWIPGRSH